MAAVFYIIYCQFKFISKVIDQINVDTLLNSYLDINVSVAIEGKHVYIIM